MENMPEEARSQQNPDMQMLGTPDELVTTRVDVSQYVLRKVDAFRAHVSQNDPDSWFTKVQDQLYEMAFGTEYYQLARGKPRAPLPEPDLFSGIS
jgi:mycothiol S-conjugate amidase